MTLALALTLGLSMPVLAGNLTLPLADPNPTITSWTDHHYPTRQADGIMIRFDGLTGYAYDGHRGTDFAEPANTPVVAADDGTVIYSEWSDSGGWGVVIDHAHDRTAYFHNNLLFVYPGQRVSRGQLIALSGSTGNSTGPHVHFEVRDLLDPWHSIDPFGWIGRGPDPWVWDQGYLWTSNPPRPFLLPLAYVQGARWNHWYGLDGAPPPITWRLRDGWGHGLNGFNARWDQDPGPEAAHVPAQGGAATMPGAGAHTLHLRVWDGTGTTADITYLYLYDTDRPASSLSVGTSGTTLVPLHWDGSDVTSGVQDVRVEMRSAAGAPVRPWWLTHVAQPLPGRLGGSLRFLGEPGTTYDFELRVSDQARNAGPIATSRVTVPADAVRPPSSIDQLTLGPLPDMPDSSGQVLGAAQEHPQPDGALALGADGSLHGLGATATPVLATPPGDVPAVDAVQTSSGWTRLLADGSTWSSRGVAGQRLRIASPIRLLAASDAGLLAVSSDGSLVGLPGLRLSSPPSPGTTIVDAGLFPASHAGIALDGGGVLHTFGDVDPGLAALPTRWTLAGQPAGIVVGGSTEAPAGLLLDSAGHRQTFGSQLLLPEAVFAGPTFDPLTGLVVR